MSNSLSFGAWLKRRRRTLDLTQQALADQAHCSIVTIRKIESGDLAPSRQLAGQLANVLQIDEADQAEFVRFARTRDATAEAAAFTTRSEPAARSDIATRTHRVPASLGSLVGREWEISAVCDLLGRDGVRVVTLTGPPGTGKTRLSLAIAEQLQADWAHGACFVPLAAVSDSGLVIQAMAQALGVSESEDRSLFSCHPGIFG